MTLSGSHSFASRWLAFWFTPQDPTLLGLMRILAGVITLYTFAVHGMTLQALMGERGWFDLATRLDTVYNRPVLVPPLGGNASPLPRPVDDFQREYQEAYRKH